MKYLLGVDFGGGASKATLLRTDGTIAAGGGPDLRRAMLEAEGVPFTPDGRVDMARCRWP